MNSAATDSSTSLGDGSDVSSASSEDDRASSGPNQNAFDEITTLGFGFRQPAIYTYDIAQGQGNLEIFEDTPAKGQLIVDVQTVTDKEVTLTMSYELNGNTFEKTFSGEQYDVATELGMMSGEGGLLLTTAIGTLLGSYLQSGKLAVGEGWFAKDPNQGTMNFEISDTESYAGVSCYVGEMKINDHIFRTGCVSPELGLPAYAAIYDENGVADTWIKLINYKLK